MGARNSRLTLLLQLAGTLVILLCVPGTLLQTLLLFILWAGTFYPLSRADAVLFLTACLFYTVADIAVVQRGVFRFSHADFFGLPYYEPFMWGFYFLHAKRMLGGALPRRLLPGIVLTVTVAATATLVSDTFVSAVLIGIELGVALFLFHTKTDFRYILYLAALGVIVEALGTATGQWSYGVPYYVLWWVVTWSASGLILYRTGLPLAAAIATRFRTT
ncbi:MAG TPA: hypothetical protein VMV50_01180 [Candidatus Paceibacterota bacterium]|nr:hypothetical protein [Candidatus Paceibacterota bacterium]